MIVDDDNIILGMISLTSINYLNQSAELHILMGDFVNQGKGIGTLAVKEILNHGFNNLNLNRIQLNVLVYNDIAIKLYEKCGFKLEGKKIQAVYKNGKFVDMYI
ncbi:MAG: GNAT family protein [Anaerococcus vaginalis]|nr:GNAT family protein [Anaerococcus vaginalis]